MAAMNFDAGALGLHGASRKIGKRPSRPKPVIIYMASPEIIHVEADEFLPLVQRLTGPDASGGREAAGKKTAPARVKARALKRHGPAVSVAAEAAPPPPSEFLFHDLSPILRGGALKGDGSMAPPSWLHHGGDHFLGSSAAPSGHVDIFEPIAPSQQ